MTDREKLIALLTEAKYEGFKICGNHIDCDDCPAFKDGSRCTESITADHLIANGVTFVTDTNDGSKKTSKQKTKDILDWVQSTAEVDWGFMCCLKQELEQLVAIASRENASGSKWVSVTERLPEPGKDVLILLRWGAVEIGFISDGEWVDCAFDRFSRCEVTHWMSLPEPPKGE